MKSKILTILSVIVMVGCKEQVKEVPIEYKEGEFYPDTHSDTAVLKGYIFNRDSGIHYGYQYPEPTISTLDSGTWDGIGISEFPDTGNHLWDNITFDTYSDTSNAVVIISDRLTVDSGTQKWSDFIAGKDTPTKWNVRAGSFDTTISGKDIGGDQSAIWIDGDSTKNIYVPLVSVPSETIVHKSKTGLSILIFVVAIMLITMVITKTVISERNKNNQP